MLFDAAEKLVRFQLIFTRTRTSQQAHVKNNHIAPPRFDAVQYISRVVQIEVIADGHQDVARTRTYRFGSQLAFQFQVELVHFDVGHAAVFPAAFGNGENQVQQNRKSSASHGGHGFGEQVGDGNQKKNKGDQAKADGDLHAAHREIERHLKFALAGIGVAQHQYRQAIHREAPDDSEGVKVR